MNCYVVRLRLSESECSTGTPTAAQAVELVGRAKSEGWSMTLILRNLGAITEANLRRDAEREGSFTPGVGPQLGSSTRRQPS